MKTNLTTRMVSFVLTIVLLVGIMPTAAFATEEDIPTASTENVDMVPVTKDDETTTESASEKEEVTTPTVEETVNSTSPITEDEAIDTTPTVEDVVTPSSAEENSETTTEDIVSTSYGRTFRMPGRYVDFIRSHERYGTREYLACELEEEFIIMFFEQDVKQFVVKDVKYDDYANYFGISPGYSPQITIYKYDKNTLELKGISNDIYGIYGFYYTYTFIASFDIYWYSGGIECFYDTTAVGPKVEVTNPQEDVETITLGRRFTMPGDYRWLLQNCSEYGEKEYLLYLWEEMAIIWFFDDASDVKFNKWNVFDTYFGMRPSRNVTVTRYIFNRNTLKFRSKDTIAFNTSNQYKFSYQFIASFDIFWDNSFNRDDMFYDRSGTLPAVDIPNLPEGIQNVTNGRTLTLQDRFTWLLQSHDEYGTKDYLTNEWNDDIRICFLDDISNVKFSVYEKFGDNFVTYFGIRPSADVTFTEYVYNKYTLKLKRVEERSFTTSNGFTFTYPSFMASFDIYQSTSYDNDYMFFDSSGTLPKIELQNPPEDIWNVTNGKTFHLKSELVWLLQNCNEYGSKNYLAYEWNDDVRIWFFDDISNVNFSTYEKFGDNFATYFGIRPSADVTFTEYVYNKNTLKFKRAEERSFVTTNGFTFMYPFTASFDIYTDDSCTEYFYKLNENWSDNSDKGEPLKGLGSTTAGKRFNLSGKFTKIIIDHRDFGSKAYLAYESGNEFSIIFFEDINGVKFRTSNVQEAYFKLETSKEVQYTQYTYDTGTLQIKNVKAGTGADLANITFPYYFMASFYIYRDSFDGEYFYRINGDRPTLPTVKVSTIERNKFGMDKVYCDKVKECPEYKQGQRYLAYLTSAEFVIWFFDDPDVKFSATPKEDNYFMYFGIQPSVSTMFTAYVYKRSTLELKSQTLVSLERDNGYTLSYNFVANIDIYKDETYKSYFYYGDEDVRNASYMFNVTNERTFSMPNSVLQKVDQLREDDATLNNKNFLAYSWEDRNIIWFLDTQNKSVEMQERVGNTFGLLFQSDIEVTAFLYDRETGEFVEQSTFTVGSSSSYSFGHYFIADFNIYKNHRLFYNASNNTVGRALTFTPLTPQEAKNFLRFLANAKPSENIEEKLPDYYKLLIGEIKNPKEALEQKSRFLRYASDCMNIQLLNSGMVIDRSETALIKWLKDQELKQAGDDEESDDRKNFLEQFISDIYIDVLETIIKTIAKGKELAGPGLPDPKTAEELLDYSFRTIDVIRGIESIRTIDNIQYLKAYKKLLDALDGGEEYDIQLAEMDCFVLKLNMSMGGDITEMENYAKYLYLIEKTLTGDYLF